MRLVPTSRVQDGATLARDVLVGRPDGIPLLRAGVRLNVSFRQGLERAGIHAVYIEDALSEGITVEPLISDHTRSLATRAVATAYEDAKQSVGSGRPLASGTIDSLTDIVAQILDEIGQSDGVALALADLASVDSYTFQHSIDVTALGLLLGRRLFEDRGWIDYKGDRQFKRMDERLLLLGLGLLLHDVGKLAVPATIVQKPGRLTPQEWEIMKSHPRAGVDLLQGSMWSPLVKGVVLRHHERWDGSGYPDGKHGGEIHEMARIAAVADVYDAITSERVYANARPAQEGVRVILEGSGKLFDPDIAEVFSRLVAPYPPGADIELADGRRGIVASVPDNALDRPVVRVIDGPGAPYEIALAEQPGVRIAGWDLNEAPAAA